MDKTDKTDKKHDEKKGSFSENFVAKALGAGLTKQVFRAYLFRRLLDKLSSATFVADEGPGVDVEIDELGRIECWRWVQNTDPNIRSSSGQPLYNIWSLTHVVDLDTDEVIERNGMPVGKPEKSMVGGKVV